MMIRSGCSGEKRKYGDQHSVILSHIRLKSMNPKRVKISLRKHRGRAIDHGFPL